MRHPSCCQPMPFTSYGRPGRATMDFVHVSELADYRVANVEDAVKVGDEITVKVVDIDNLGRVNLSRRAVLNPEHQPAKREARPPSRDSRPPRNDSRSNPPRRDD